MTTRIVIDSSADVRADLKNRFSIVPLSIHFADTTYLDGVTIDHQAFYEKLMESDILPTTSQASPAAFTQVFQEAADSGEEVIVLTLSAKLSGTFQSAMIAAADFPGRVRVIDTQSVAIGVGVLAELALRLADRGMSTDDIEARLLEERDNICVIAMLDTLEYLKKGGRISKTAAFAGELLSIKPVISLKDGEIVILGKARGSRQGNNLLVEKIQSAGGVDFNKPVLLGYTGLSDILLQKYIRDSAHLWEEGTDHLNVTTISSVIGTHAGPGAIAAAFFKKGHT